MKSFMLRGVGTVICTTGSMGWRRICFWRRVKVMWQRDVNAAA